MLEDSSEAILEVEDLSKSYGNVKALINISLRISRRTLLGLLGPNGSGKSTFIRTIMNLQKPDSGRIRIFGKDPSKNHSEIYRRVGYMPELPNLPDFMTGYQFLEFVARINGLSLRDARNRALEMLDLVGLRDAMNRRIGKYSKGMIQRLGVAQALIHDPELVILDEPTLGMDPEGRVFFRELFKRLVKDGKTLIMSSHLLDDVEKTATHLAIIYRGKLMFFGDTEKALSMITYDPVIRVEVEGDVESIAKRIRELEYVKDISINGSIMEITIDHNAGDSVRREISMTINRYGGVILSMEIRRASLEKAYIRSLRMDT